MACAGQATCAVGWFTVPQNGRALGAPWAWLVGMGVMGAVFVHRKVTYGYATFDVNLDNTLTYKFLLHPDELLDGDKVNFNTFPVR